MLKDYYYFLGVARDASGDDIRRAYRKLSLKYHPDKNENDPYFSQRFQEVQEAYETLVDADSRAAYDKAFDAGPKSTRSNLPPFIKTFSSNKIRARKGDEVILNWQAGNADLVKILPFGLEKPYGERTFRITEFKNGQFHVVLQATNTLINKSVVQGITIIEIDENAIPDLGQRNFEASAFPTASQLPKRKFPVLMVFITVLTLLILIAVLVLR